MGTNNTKAKHTPGPWKVRFSREGDPDAGFFVEAPKTDKAAPYNIEILSEDSGYYPIEQRLADAKLIAAAPELLKALIEMLPENNDPAFNGEPSLYAVNQAKEAIKKATE